MRFAAHRRLAPQAGSFCFPNAFARPQSGPGLYAPGSTATRLGPLAARASCLARPPLVHVPPWGSGRCSGRLPCAALTGALRAWALRGRSPAHASSTDLASYARWPRDSPRSRAPPSLLRMLVFLEQYSVMSNMWILIIGQHSARSSLKCTPEDDSFRLVADAVLWQACDRCRRYQTSAVCINPETCCIAVRQTT